MKAARYGDVWSGICCCHPPIPCIGMSGIIIQSSEDTKINNKGSARLGDIVIGSCGHTGIIVTASSTVKVNNKGKARVGDVVSGCCQGTIVSGSPNVETF